MKFWKAKKRFTTILTTKIDEPIPVVKKAPPKKKVVKKVVKKPVEAEVRDDEDVEQENEVENGAVEITSDAEDDRGLVMRKLSTLNR